ncbi:hypothetical protein, partial [Listeria monocytogenes]|uniref:hypothetical protein n=1 Tax=Listeria monocytogenes TaxID=1639 RepID=UPI001C0B10FC
IFFAGEERDRIFFPFTGFGRFEKENTFLSSSPKKKMPSRVTRHCNIIKSASKEKGGKKKRNKRKGEGKKKRKKRSREGRERRE